MVMLQASLLEISEYVELVFKNPAVDKLIDRRLSRRLDAYVLHRYLQHQDFKISGQTD